MIYKRNINRLPIQVDNTKLQNTGSRMVASFPAGQEERSDPGKSRGRVSRWPAILVDAARYIVMWFRQARRRAMLDHQVLQFDDHLLRDIGAIERDIRPSHRNWRNKNRC